MARGVQFRKMNAWKQARVLDAFFREKRQEASKTILIAKAAQGGDTQAELDDYLEYMFPNRKGSEEFFEEHEEEVREEIGKEYEVEPISEKDIQEHVKQGGTKMGGMENFQQKGPGGEDN